MSLLLTQGRFLFPKDIPNNEIYKELEFELFNEISEDSFELNDIQVSLIIKWF